MRSREDVVLAEEVERGCRYLEVVECQGESSVSSIEEEWQFDGLPEYTMLPDNRKFVKSVSKGK